MPPPHDKRLFVAIKPSLNDEFLKTLSSLKQNMVLEKMKWVEPENFHLTLKFLGKTPVEKIPLITQALSDIAQKHTVFSFTFDKIGIFGSRYQPKILWLGTDRPTQNLITLAEDILEGLHQAGFPRDRQNFVPHITISRIKQIIRKKAFQEVLRQYQNSITQQIVVDRFYLYESILRPQGPEYKIIKTFALSSFHP